MAGNGAHSAIDNLIVAHTLEEILRNKRGEYTDLLYQVDTEKGDKRYIHRGIQGLSTDEKIETQSNVLRTLLENNPAFADTVSLEEGKKRLAPHPSIKSRLKEALGF